ncbi:MAG: hypothetical protein WCD70_16445 [Alphaproteobacteria bacterium]
MSFDPGTPSALAAPAPGKAVEITPELEATIYSKHIRAYETIKDILAELKYMRSFGGVQDNEMGKWIAEYLADRKIGGILRPESHPALRTVYQKAELTLAELFPRYGKALTQYQPDQAMQAEGYRQ